MAKKESSRKQDSKTGKFVGKGDKGTTSKGKGSSSNKNSSKDKVGTNGTGAKNRRDKK